MSAPSRSRQMQTLTLVPLRERLCRFFGSQIYEFGIIALIGINAVVLAAAGLVRLDLEDHITERLPLDMMLPAPAT